ncbi:hypothetical protein [Herbidospora mongoliensis]|uniref:hypothetical protein n=1 Tax=Herbidospora mongoliensis TaxID=688067 RepID=UPI000A0098DC|nr:hypothetical protein [Herbidospora mongoliensis]
MTSGATGGFIGNLEDAFAPPAAGGCCGSPAATDEAPAEVNADAVSCCGSAPAAKEAADTGCCGKAPATTSTPASGCCG